MPIRIALAQINPVVGDLAGNVARINRAVADARQARADLVVLPELAVCGYPPEDLLLRRRFLHDCRDALDEIIPHTAGITALVGFPDTDEGTAYNAAALLHDGRIVGACHKVELPNYSVFDEQRYFRPGADSFVFELAGARLIATICEDVWVRDGAVVRAAADSGASIALNLSGSPFYAGKLACRHEVLSRFARDTRTTVCYANLVGGQDELVFDGGSLVVSPTGEVLARAKRFEEDLLLVDLSTATPPPDAPEPRLRLQTAAAAGRQPIAPTLAPELSRIEEVHAALVLGTRDYIRKNGFKKALLGLSGGIDSSLAAAIAVEALGAENVVGVTMPSMYTSGETLCDAERLAANLGTQLHTIPIKGIYDAYLADLAGPLGHGPPGVELENLQARIRGNLLMALSNKFGWIVLTTGNKSEVAVGYCTLYGDTAGGFAVIKDVPKTLVYELSRHINDVAGRELIPESVLVRPPSAELRPGQKDQDSLPPYDTLDPILAAYVEEDLAPDDIAARGFDPDTIAHVVRLVDRSEYKRRQAPPGVKITPKAFGRDRRLPITNRYLGGIGR